MILLNAHAGLCNKLLAIGAGLHLAEDTQQKLHVFWITDSHMDVLFTDLFERQNRFVLHQLFVPRNRIVRGVENRLVPCLFPGLSDKTHGFLDYEAVFLSAAKNRPRSVHRFSSFREFYPAIDYSWLKPRPEILARIKEYRGLTTGNVIGMHIRRGDHIQAMRCSPLELFYSKIAEEIAANPSVRFFLCSDDGEVKKDLQSKYPDNVVMREGVLARNAKGGVADAVVDLWLLSQCKKIYGTYPSSFSLVASKIGKTGFAWIRNEKEIAE